MNLDLCRHYVYVGERRAQFLWSTFFGYIQCAYWGVKVGSGCRFHGRASFRRFPASAMSIGNNCNLLSSPCANRIGINRPCILSTMSSSAKVRIGDDCGLSGTVIAAFESIILGNHVICGANTLITDSNWHPEDPRSGTAAPVSIGDNVWLGVNATVLQGVSIGQNTLIGAGSIVTSDVPANVIAAGNPCRVIKPLEHLQVAGIHPGTPVRL